MKTREKEIEVWVESLCDLENDGETRIAKKMCEEQLGKYVKARLIIELPERKAELTPSQIKEAFLYATEAGWADMDRRTDMIIEKLFNKGADGE